jgi:hypothetical protein
MNNANQTLAIETYARRCYNYLERMVDQDHLPYFNVFWDDLAMAAHDWPDFGDVMSRQLQAAIMGRVMTGEVVQTEQVWRNKVLSYIDPETDLLIRPARYGSKAIPDPGDNALTLYALVTAYADNHNEMIRKTVLRMVDGMVAASKKNGIPGGSQAGFAIKGLMTCVRTLDYEPALWLAKKCVETIFGKRGLFTPQDTFLDGGHMHGNLRCLVGAVDYALCTNQAALYERINNLYQYVRSQATSFGFLPESVGRKGDIVSCETCAIMDYLGLAITLANHGHPEYWENIERVARNHLIESQVVDGSWLVSDPARPDTEQFSWRSISERMVGGFAGWSSPTHILAARETLNAHWGGPELRNRTRAFQNCCGGSGLHAFFEVWKNSARVEKGTLSIHLHLDKSLPQAEIRGYQPYCGRLVVRLKEPCRIKVRIPASVQPSEMRAEVQGQVIAGKVCGNYLEYNNVPVGIEMCLSYPLKITTEIVQIGNPGFRQYLYRVTWKGSTVVHMEALGDDIESGYSDYDRCQVPVFYGVSGPGQLYLRHNLTDQPQPEFVSPARLHQDDGLLDFWYFA